MSKMYLVTKVAKAAGITEIKAKEAVQAVFDSIKDSLVKSDKPVTIRQFGKFFIQRKKERTGRNPRTGEPVQISARRVARFKAGSTLKRVVKSQKLPEN